MVENHYALLFFVQFYISGLKCPMRVKFIISLNQADNVFTKAQRLFFFGWEFPQVQVFGGNSYWTSAHLKSVAEVLLAEWGFIDCNSLVFRAQGDWYLAPSVSVRKHLSGSWHREQCKRSSWIQRISSVWVLSSRSPSPSRVIHCHLYDFILGALYSSFPPHLHCLLLCFKNEIDSPKQLWILDRFQTYISVKLVILACPRRSPNFDYSLVSFAFSQRSSYHWLYILYGAWKRSDIMTVHIETYK